MSIGTGIGAFSKLNELGFVEFTTGLIEGVYDTIVESQIKQLKSYSDLVTSISGSVENFALNTSGLNIGDTLTSAQQSSNDAIIKSFLAATFPNSFGTTTDDGTQLHALDVSAASSLLAPTTPFTTGTVIQTIKKPAFDHLKGKITHQYDLLVELVRIGFARVDTTGGFVETNLDFRIRAAELDEVKSSQTDIRANSWYVNGKVGATFMKWGFQVNGGYASNRLRVSTTNSVQHSSVDMDARATGKVRVEFATTTFDTTMAKIKASA